MDPLVSEYLLCTQLVTKYLNFLCADNEDSGQTRMMPGLIFRSLLVIRVGVIKIVIVINYILITFSKVIACNCN